MNKNFVIFYWHVFTKRDWGRFLCDEMSARGYNVRVVQVGPAIDNLSLAEIERGNFAAVPQAETPRTKDDIERILDDLNEQDLLFVFVPVTARYLWLLVQIGKRNLKYAHLTLGRLPQRLDPTLLIRRKPLLALRAYGAALFHLLYRVRYHLKLVCSLGLDYFRIPPPFVWVRAGSHTEPLSTEGIGLGRCNVLDVESFDVAQARRIESHPPIGPAEGQSGRYAVYVDESLYNHPDYLLHNAASPIEPDRFFPALKRFFEQLENVLDLKIVIALHPKSNYSAQEKAAYFGSRETFDRQTPELIYGAEFALMHNSTALSYAVIWRKPVLFVTSDSINESWLCADLELRTNLIGQPTVNLDRLNGSDVSSLLTSTVDEELYAAYEESFLGSTHAVTGPLDEIIATYMDSQSQTTQQGLSKI